MWRESEWSLLVTKGLLILLWLFVSISSWKKNLHFIYRQVKMIFKKNFPSMFTGPFDSAPRYVGPQLHVASWVLPGSRRVLVTDQSLLSAHCYPLSHPILYSCIIISMSPIIPLQDKINTKDPHWGNYTYTKCRAHRDFSEWTDLWDPLRWTAGILSAFQTPWIHLIVTNQHPHQGNHSYKSYCNQ